MNINFSVYRIREITTFEYTGLRVNVSDYM